MSVDGIFEQAWHGRVSFVEIGQGNRRTTFGSEPAAQHMPPMIRPYYYNYLVWMGKTLVGWGWRWWGKLCNPFRWAYFYNFWVTAGTGDNWRDMEMPKGDLNPNPNPF